MHPLVLVAELYEQLREPLRRTELPVLSVIERIVFSRERQDARTAILALRRPAFRMPNALVVLLYEAQHGLVWCHLFVHDFSRFDLALSAQRLHGMSMK